MPTPKAERETAKHTPGPWTQWSDHANVFAGKVRDNLPHNINGENVRQVCSCDSEDIGDDEQSANARLVAAAPDLMAACVRIVAWLDRLAEHAEQQAKDTRFITLSGAFASDAKNYRVTATDVRRSITKATTGATK